MFRLDQDSVGLRRKIFVDPALQGTILTRVAWYWCTTVALVTIGVCGGPVLRSPWSHAISQCLHAIYDQRILYIALVFMLRLQLGDALRMSHRVAGPMHRVRRHLSNVLEGREVAELQFRRDDFWHDVARKINDLVARIDVPSSPSPSITSLEPIHAPHVPWDAGVRAECSSLASRP